MSIIRMRGTGRATLPAEEAVFSVTVKRVKKTAEEAATEAKKAVSALEERLTAHGFSKELLKTGSVDLSPEYEHTATERKAVGYACRYHLKLVTDCADETIVSAVSALTCNAAEDFRVSFGVKNEKAAVKEIYAAACNDAKQKAEAAASALGKKLGELVKIEEDDAPHAFALRAVNAEVRPEEITVEGSVSVEWEIL